MQSAHMPKRPEYRNIRVTQIVRYRLPLAGLVSILHRISGAAMFLLLPFVLWMFDSSLRSQQAFAQLVQWLHWWPSELLLVGLFWALMHHLVAGVRHLVMDAFQTVSKVQGRRLALLTLVISLLATAVFAVRLFAGA